MAYISTLSKKGAGLAKQGRFYDDWSSGNHAVNNTLLYQERVKVENRRLKLTVRDEMKEALQQPTHRMRPPENSYRSEGLSTQRTLSTGRTAMSTGRLRREEEEREAERLAQQLQDAQRALELERLIEEEQESTQVLEQKFDQITRFLQERQAASNAEARRAQPHNDGRSRPLRFKERKRQTYKVFVPHPHHGRTELRTARLSGAPQQVTARGIKRQKDFLRKESRKPRILPRKTITADRFTMAMKSKIKYEQKKW